MQFLLWLICAGVTAYVAKNKGRNTVLWLILGLVGGVISLIVVALLPKVSGNSLNGSSFGPPLNNNSSSANDGWSNLRGQNLQTGPQDEQKQICPQCGYLVSNSARYCENCGHKMRFKFNLDKDSDELLKSNRHCPKCNQLVKKGVAYCPNCGNKLSAN